MFLYVKGEESVLLIHFKKQKNRKQKTKNQTLTKTKKEMILCKWKMILISSVFHSLSPKLLVLTKL